MEIERLKITDGDLVIITVNHTGGVTQEFLTKLQKSIMDWGKKRGLNNVEFLAYGGSGAETNISIKVLSVNNVFENEVLR